MKKVSIIALLIGFGSSSLNAQDIIEREYFPNARAKNASVAAARYAEEGYHYSKFITYVSAVDSSRMFADTALFFVKRSLMLADTAISYAPKTNFAACDFLSQAVKKTNTADTILREFYPMIDLESHHVFGRDAALHLSNSVMDFFNASLLLKAEDAAPKTEDERYKVLPFDDEIVRLEADEVAFQLAANEFEEEIVTLDKMSAGIADKINKSNDQKVRHKLRQKKERVDRQLKASTIRLKDTSGRIQELRHLLDHKYLEDVEGVDEPEHLAQFETSSKEKEIEMDQAIPEGLVYKIQLGYYPNDVDIEQFHGLFPISGETVRADMGRYYAGMFYSYTEASRGNIYVRENAIANAFVVPFHNGKKISISQAVEVERQRGVK